MDTCVQASLCGSCVAKIDDRPQISGELCPRKLHAQQIHYDADLGAEIRIARSGLGGRMIAEDLTVFRHDEVGAGKVSGMRRQYGQARSKASPVPYDGIGRVDA